MLKMFRKKKAVENQHPKMEKVASFLANTIINTQTRIANWLGKQEQKLTTTQKKIAFFTFCICVCAIAGSLLYRGIFNGHNNIPEWLKQQSITIPQTQPLPDSINADVLKGFNKNHQTPKSKTDSINQ